RRSSRTTRPPRRTRSTATDASGNAAEPVSFTVTVLDTTPPALAAVADLVVEATGADGAIVSFDAPATTDAVDGDGVATCEPVSGTLFAMGSTTVGCVATDAAGNSAEMSFVVTVVDTTAPVLAPVGDIVAEAASADGVLVVFDAPATTDAVDGDGVATCSPASGSLFPIGTTLVTCVAQDAAGNAAAPVSFEVRVVDTTAPVVAAVADLVVEATGADGAVVAYDAPATTDAVDGDGVATCSPASGSVFALGVTTVTCGASDAAGNAAEPASFTVTVVDTTAPVLATMADLRVNASGLQGAVVTYNVPAALDAVDGELDATCSPASGSLFAVGNTTVTCTATDAAGNVGSSSFVVRVTFVVKATLKADQPTYTLAQAAQSGIRVTYHLEAGDGTPLSNVNVTVVTLRQLTLVGYVDSERHNGTTDENGDFVFYASAPFSTPASYVLLGSTSTPGISGGASGRYVVNAL
ncbi:MAG TPA: HYR domain-containing protein, partial [Candidatus Thermoplasmatota archaeon]|nr:HYR domain-containing protein [Candidatus Thermoplasmatota archaeon]